MSKIVAILLVAACVAALETTPIIPMDYTSNITIVDAGITYHGYIVSDLTGQRTFRYVKELNEITYYFQAFNQAVTYAFTILNSGCTCQRTSSATIPNYFASLVAAQKSAKGCEDSTTGTLYTNNILKGLPAVPTSNFCMDGNIPKYVQRNSEFIKFTNFKAGRPSDFPVSPMDRWVNQCSDACL